MTAFTFMAKGSGTIAVEFTSKYGLTESTCVYRINTPLQPTWTKHTIQASAIGNSTSAENITIPWSQGRTSITNINFLASEDAELWLDDILIEGMNPVDFIKK